MGKNVITCSAENCGKKVFDNGKCSEHFDRKTTEIIKHNFVLLPTDVGKIDPTFLSKAKEKISQTAINQALVEPVKKPLVARIDLPELHHYTHGTGQTCRSVWYLWDAKKTTMTVYGVGQHIGKGNKNYSVTWYDGKVKDFSIG